MFNMNERVYNSRSQIQSVPRQVSMFHPQASQVIYPQPSMFHPQASQVIYPQPSMIHPQSYQMIHPQSYQVIHPQSSQVIHQQTSQAAAVSLQSSADPIQVDSSLVAPHFLLTDDPLECLTKALTFMSTILASIYPSSNNQLETSSNPMHQVAMPERQTLSYVGNCSTGNDHIARPYTQSKKIQCLKQQLSKEQLAILANTRERIDFGIGAFTVTTNALFRADGVEVYDSDCDDVPNAQPSLMANILSYGSNALAEVHNPDNVDNNMINHGVQVKPSSEQSNVVNHSETEITSDSIIPYSQYVTDSQQTAVQNSNLSAQQDALILYMIEQLKSQNSINSSDSSPFCRPTKVKVPKELPKVSMVNTSLKKLKHHLAGFDVVVKERTTSTAITEGSWGFEHIKACFRDEIIPFDVEQHHLESKTFEVKMNKVLNENERILEQVISKDIVNIIMNSSVDNAYVNVRECEKCLKLETELLNKKDFVGKEIYDKLFRSYTTLEKHCISLEVNTQLNQEIFQRDNSVSNQSAPSFDQYFELNELKAQSQEKDTVIKKLKERIKSLSGNMNEDKIKKDIEEIETINIELDHRVSKLIAENEHLKQTYKQLYDSIKPTRVQSQEQCDALVNQNELRKLKGKSVIACRESVNKPKVIAPVVHKVDLEPLSPKLKNNREAHVDYIRITKENVDTLHDIVEQDRTSNPLDNASPLKSEKLVAVTPTNKARKVTFAKTSTTSYNNTQIQVDVHQTQTTSKPLVPSTNEKCSTNASRSKPCSETKNHRIMQPLSSNQKSQKIEAHTRNAKPSLTKEDSESKYVCLTYNKCFFDARHNLYVVQYLSEVNDRARSKAVKSIKMKEWKPTRKMFKNVGYKWVPTRRTFTIVGTKCPLTIFTSTKIVPPRKHVKSTVITNIKPSSASQWRPKETNHARSSSESKIVESRTANHLEPNNHMGSNVSISTCSSSVQCSSSGPALHEMTPATISSGLVPNPPPSTPFVPPSRTPEVIAPIDEVVAPVPAVSTGSPSSTIVDQDAPSPSNSQTTPETQFPILPNNVEEDNHDLDVAHMTNDLFFGITIPENDSEASSSDVIPIIVQTAAPNSEHVTKWTKDHPLDNIISELKRPVSTRLQLHEQALFCYYDAFLTSVKPKNYKDALTQACWIEAMQEELYEFERLEVWELVPHPDKVMVITLKWIYKVKLDEIGGILKNKARLVARGYRQEEGIYFEEL
ncbi:retrovirus-related pol polyprotein from transposon TNT 1-94 [Tanacetum coccineum]